MKIIIIDDEKYIRRMISDFLKNEGHEVIEGKDGFDGIEKIMQNPDIGLILLDVRMPCLC
ncbi:MAG: response regulator [Acholeplasmataceae bacterium]|nr:response regulator [Acholeplasmataceae bacterium]